METILLLVLVVVVVVVVAVVAVVVVVVATEDYRETALLRVEFKSSPGSTQCPNFNHFARERECV